MILDECCLNHIPYEILDKTPTENDWDYPVPFIRIDKKDKKAWILVDNKDAKATWIEIAYSNKTIQKILTDCGEIEPNEKGEIIINGQCGIRAVSDNCPDFCINLLTGYGLKGGGQICKGETRTIELDADITGNVKGADSAQVGDVPVFKDETGKSITTSNINSVDGLTKITKSSKGEQKLLVETADTENGSNAGVEAKSTGSGYPYFQLTQGDQKWREIINTETGAREIRPVDDLSKDSLLNFLPNGVITGNLQPKCSARLTDSSPTFNRNEYFKIGSNIAFTKIRDEDGYNKSANNLFLGGTDSYLYYKIPYSGTWCIIYKFVIDQGRVASGTRIVSRINFGAVNDLQQIKTEEHYPNSSYKTISDTILLPLNKDDIVFVDVLIESDQGNPYVRVAAVLKEIDNYFGCFLTLG